MFAKVSRFAECLDTSHMAGFAGGVQSVRCETCLLDAELRRSRVSFQFFGFFSINNVS